MFDLKIIIKNTFLIYTCIWGWLFNGTKIIIRDISSIKPHVNLSLRRTVNVPKRNPIWNINNTLVCWHLILNTYNSVLCEFGERRQISRKSISKAHLSHDIWHTGTAIYIYFKHERTFIAVYCWNWYYAITGEIKLMLFC